MEEDRATTLLLSEEQVAAVREVAAIAALQAGKALSRLFQTPIKVSAPELANFRLSEIPAMFGGPDAPAIGVLVPFQGDMEGNALLLFPEKGIREVEGILPGSSGQAAEDLRLSAFAEMGNILTGQLLTVLSGLSERIVVSLPPLLVHDMAGALLDTVLSEAQTPSGEVTVLVFRLTDAAGAGLVSSILIPGRTGIGLFLEAADRLKSGP